MQITPIGSALVGLEFISIGSSSGSYFSFFANIPDNPYNNPRWCYLREKFGENQFSAKWERLYPVNGETHLLYLPSFSGISREFQVKAVYKGGFTLDFYEIEPSIVGGDNSPEGTQQGIRGEYHAGVELNDLRLTRIDTTLTFGWGNGSPHIDVPADNFSVKWVGFIHVETAGQYRFVMNKKLRYILKLGGFTFERTSTELGSDSHNINLVEGNNPLEFSIFHETGNSSFNFRIDRGNGVEDLTVNDLRY